MDYLELKRNIHYNENTGKFTWINKRLNGKDAGSKDKDGYIIIKIGGKNYKSHHLAILYTTGIIPKYVHHKNGIRDDNRIVNLEECNHEYNMQYQKKYSNNTTGYVGIGKVLKRSKYRARIGQKQIGTFDNIEDAVDYRIKYKNMIQNISYLDLLFDRDFGNSGTATLFFNKDNMSYLEV